MVFDHSGMRQQHPGNRSSGCHLRRVSGKRCCLGSLGQQSKWGIGGLLIFIPANLYIALTISSARVSGGTFRADLVASDFSSTIRSSVFENPSSALQPTILTSATFEMCDKAMRHYAGCGHQVFYEFRQCHLARARPDGAICVPPSGHQRDLDQALDVQDQNLSGKCPPCNGHSPHSSQGSQWWRF